MDHEYFNERKWWYTFAFFDPLLTGANGWLFSHICVFKWIFCELGLPDAYLPALDLVMKTIAGLAQ